MQEPNKKQQHNLKFIQVDNEEEGFEAEVPPDMGGNLMIQRSMVILEKEQRHSSCNEYFCIRGILGSKMGLLRKIIK